MSRVLQICNDLYNVGDLLAPIVTEKLFGLDVVRVFKTLPDCYSNHRVLGGIGSFLGYYGDWPLSVWGTGFEPGYVDSATRKNPGSRVDWDIRAVRGHITRKILKLDENTPIGDPSLFLPEIYVPECVSYERIRYFTHYDNTDDDFGIQDYFEVCSSRMDPFRAIDLITSSGFVFTESLHVAILSHAYKIPWAWSLNKHHRAMVKWFDWFSSIGAYPSCFTYRELDKARQWYESQQFSVVDHDVCIALA